MNNTNNYFLPKDALEDICSVAVAKTLLTLGLSSGEINFSQAKRVFGKDFLLLYNTVNGKVKFPHDSI
ncbi:MAG: hypothetical protein IJ151_09140 [Bacteroidales bacterium]|nr:hypothetical protein [Bacteroidales bacterium]